jgi:hypothetical protein
MKTLSDETISNLRKVIIDITIELDTVFPSLDVERIIQEDLIGAAASLGVQLPENISKLCVLQAVLQMTSESFAFGKGS